MTEPEKVSPLPEPTDDLVVVPAKRYAKVPRVMINEDTGEAIELTKKQCTFVRHVPEMGRTGAAKFAKISDELAHDTLKLPAVQQYMRKVLWAAGVVESKIAQRIAEGLDAVSQKAFYDKDAGVVMGPEQVDYEQRGKYIDRALRLQGLDKSATEAPGGALPPGANLAVLSVEALTTLITELQRLSGPPAAGAIDVTPEA